MNEFSNLSDKEFDDLFKSSANQSSGMASEDAWQKMASKLDSEVDKRRPFGYWKEIFGVLLLFFVGSTLFFVNNGYFKDSSLVKNIDVKKNQKEALSIKNDNIITDSKALSKRNLDSQESDISPEAEKAIKYEKIIMDKSIVSKNINQPNSSAKEQLENGTNNSKAIKNNNVEENSRNLKRLEKAANDNKSELKYKRDLISNEEKIRKEKVQIEINNDNNLSDNKNGIVNTTKTESEVLDNSLEKKELAIASVNDKNEEISATPENVLAEPSKNKKSKISFIAGLSPDYSRVGNGVSNTLGSNFQFLVDVAIGKRFHLKTGIIRSAKKYDAKGSEYAMPEKWKLSSNNLVSVDAVCKVIDIPLLLSYDFTQKPNNNFYASAGLTSYQMMSESYSFSYQNNADPQILMRNWDGKSKFLPFGLLNLSVGFERKINDKFSVQLEPFFKTPLKTIGMGSVRLESYGAFINLKFRPKF